jgi:hypothetical protein
MLTVVPFMSLHLILLCAVILTMKYKYSDIDIEKFPRTSSLYAWSRTGTCCADVLPMNGEVLCIPVEEWREGLAYP